MDLIDTIENRLLNIMNIAANSMSCEMEMPVKNAGILCKKSDLFVRLVFSYCSLIRIPLTPKSKIPIKSKTPERHCIEERDR